MSDTEHLEAPATDLVEPETQEAPDPEPAAEAATAGTSAEPDPSQPTNDELANANPQADGASADQASPDIQAELNRLRNFEKLAGTLGREVGEHRKFRAQYEGLPPAEELRGLIEQQKRAAESANLRSWNPRHPDFHQTSRRLERADAYAAAVRASERNIASRTDLDDSQRQALFDRSRSDLAREMGIGNQDIELYNQRREYAQQVNDEFTQDPDEFVYRRSESVARSVVREELNALMAQERARQTASQFAEQHKQLITENRDKFIELLPRYGREGAAEILSLQARLRELESGVARAAAIEETAKAQTQSLQKRARVGRDPSVDRTFQDPVTMAKERGLLPNTPAFTRFIREQTEKQRQAQNQ